jgi:hypothetical protein
MIERSIDLLIGRSKNKIHQPEINTCRSRLEQDLIPVGGIKSIASVDSYPKIKNHGRFRFWQYLKVEN